MLIAIIALVLVLIILVIGFIIQRILLHRRTKDSWDTVVEKRSRLIHQTSALEAFEWIKGREEFKVVDINSNDGLNLRAYELENGDNWAICVHGYHVDARIMSVFAKNYVENGFSVLMPNLRGHGISEGNWVTMGYKDKGDLLSWINYLREKNPNVKILLHGASMGGATVLNAAGENPDGVRAVIADCAFSNARGVYSFHLKQMKFVTKIPWYYAFCVANFFVQGFNINNADSRKQVAKTKLPIFFIHGDADRYVPYYMMEELYSACLSEKEQHTCGGAEHFLSHIENPEQYKKLVRAFLEKYYF